MPPEINPLAKRNKELKERALQKREVAVEALRHQVRLILDGRASRDEPWEGFETATASLIAIVDDTPRARNTTV